MLTPDQVKMYREKYGLDKPVQNNTPSVEDRLKRIDDIVNKATSEKRNIVEPPKETILQENKPKGSILDIVPKVGEAVGSASLGFVQGLLNIPNEVAGLTTKVVGVKPPPKLLPQVQNIKAPNQVAQNMGRGAEQIAEFLIPASAPQKAVKAVEAFTAAKKANVLAKGAVNLLARMGVGSAEMGGITALQTEGDAEKTVKAAKTGAALGVAGWGIKQLGEGLKWTGNKIQSSVIRPTQKDIKDGFKIENVQKWNVGGSLNDTLRKTTEQMNELSNQLATKIKQSKKTIDLNKTYKIVEDGMGGDKAKVFGDAEKIKSALENLKSEIQLVAPEGKIGMVEAQTIKRAAGAKGAWSHGIPDPDARATEKVYTTFYRVMKKQIEDKSPAGVKEINKLLSELIPIYHATIRRIPVAERNNLISLSDTIGVFSTVFDPKAIPVAIMNKILKMGQTGDMLYKQGTKLTKPSKIAPLIKGAITKTITGD